MRHRVAVLVLALTAVAVTDTPEAVRFIQPIRPIVFTVSGSADIALRVRVEPHPENRWLDVDIYQGTVRVGGWGDAIDGEQDAALFPEYKPMIQRLGVGDYVFTARACKGSRLDGERTVCDAPRAVASMRFQVCGGAGEEDAC
jgi:hypothetical protein